MALGAVERGAAKYTCTRQRIAGPNGMGWKVAHIEDVGLGFSAALTEVPLDTLCAHFQRFLSPRNTFLVPLAYAGVAETPEFIEAFKAKNAPA
jgi:hypothetical protein